MISTESKLIFIHIPKCGGCSIEKIFNSELMNHQTALEISKKHQILWKKYYKFTIVRNTWDRLVSIYHFRKKNGRLSKWTSDDKIWEENPKIKKNWQPNFSEWLKKIILFDTNFSRDNLLLHPGIHSQLDYFLINNENFLNEIIDFKEIYKVQKILDKFNLRMIHINKTKHKHYSYYYTKELIELVYNRFEKEIRHLNFKFESKFKIF